MNYHEVRLCEKEKKTRVTERERTMDMGYQRSQPTTEMGRIEVKDSHAIGPQPTPPKPRAATASRAAHHQPTNRAHPQPPPPQAPRASRRRAPREARDTLDPRDGPPVKVPSPLPRPSARQPKTHRVGGQRHARPRGYQQRPTRPAIVSSVNVRKERCDMIIA